MKNKALSIFKKIGFWLLVVLALACTTAFTLQNFFGFPLIGQIIESTIKRSELSDWKKEPVLDKFGDAVPGQFTTSAIFEGSMTNAAVNNAYLLTKVDVLDTLIGISFLEYGNQKAMLPESEFLNAEAKLASGNVKPVSFFFYGGFMTDSDGSLIALLRTENKPFKVVADLSRMTNGLPVVYSFEINPQGFNEASK